MSARTIKGRKYAFRNKLLTVQEIMDESGSSLSIDTVRTRLGKGYSVETALTLPYHQGTRRPARATVLPAGGPT